MLTKGKDCYEPMDTETGAEILKVGEWIRPQISISTLILAAGNTSNTYSIRTVVTGAHTIRCHHRPIHVRQRQKKPTHRREEEETRTAQNGRERIASHIGVNPQCPQDSQEMKISNKREIRPNGKGQIRGEESMAAAPLPLPPVRLG